MGGSGSLSAGRGRQARVSPVVAPYGHHARGLILAQFQVNTGCGMLAAVQEKRASGPRRLRTGLSEALRGETGPDRLATSGEAGN